MKIEESAIVALSLLLIGAWSGVAQASPELLKDALLCKGNPLEAVERAARDNAYDTGVASTSFGEGRDARTVFVLRDPLTAGGGETRAVVLERTPSNAGFKAIVYAQFSGKPKEAVKVLGLEPVPAGQSITVGAFEKSLGKDLHGNKGVSCPKTIGLTPLPRGGFLLGCGWCGG